MVDWTAPSQVTTIERDTARMALRELMPWMGPADKQFRATQLGRLAAHYPSKGRPDGQDRVVARDFDRLLADLPADILQAAVDDCLRVHKFMPTVAEIRAAAGKELSRRLTLRYRLKRVAEARVTPPVVPAQREQIEAIMAKFRTGQRV
jgi:hypothetical protein